MRGRARPRLEKKPLQAGQDLIVQLQSACESDGFFAFLTEKHGDRKFWSTVTASQSGSPHYKWAPTGCSSVGMGNAWSGAKESSALPLQPPGFTVSKLNRDWVPGKGNELLRPQKRLRGIQLYRRRSRKQSTLNRGSEWCFKGYSKK